MQNKRSVKIITESNLCISCGVCVHNCPFDNIKMEYNVIRGKWDAEVTEEKKCQMCNGDKICLYVCPSYDTNYSIWGSNENNMLGKIETVYNGWSKDDETRYHSSSGGFVRSFCQDLLDKEIINGVISIKHQSGLDYTPSIINDLKQMPTSIYHNINYKKVVDLLMNYDGRYLVIGLPCQLTGLELLLSKGRYKKLKKKVYLKLALICGYSFERVNMEFFASSNVFNMESVSYREKGRYRKTRLNNSVSSLVLDVYHPKNINEKINNMIMFDPYLAQKACLYCVDHISYCADLVVGDAWQKRYKNDCIGTNIIICRNSLSKQLVTEVKSFNLEKGSLNEIEESQNVYAKPLFGFSNANINLAGTNYIPKHKIGNIKKIFLKIPLTAKLKATILRQLLYKRKFKLVKAIYVIISMNIIIISFIKYIVRGKF